MAFVREKEVRKGAKRYTYYQVVRNYRERGRHRQKVLLHLGKHPSVSSAIEARRKEQAGIKAIAYERFKFAERVKKNLLQHNPTELRKELPDLEEARVRAEKASKIYEEYFDLPLHERSGQRRYELESSKNTWAYVVHYHNVMEEAMRYEDWATELQSEIDKLLEIKNVYFVR